MPPRISGPPILATAAELGAIGRQVEWPAGEPRMDEIVDRLAATPIDGAADRGARDALTWLITGGALAARTGRTEAEGDVTEVGTGDAAVPGDVAGDIVPPSDGANEMSSARRVALARGDPRPGGRWWLMGTVGFLVAAQLALVPRWVDGPLGSPRSEANASLIARGIGHRGFR